MNEPYRYAPPVVIPPSEDERYLKILSVCHYVCAGFVGLFSFIPAMYIALGVMAEDMPVRPMPAVPAGHHAPPDPGAMMGGIFIAIGIVGVLMCLVTAAMLVFAGRAVASRTRMTLIIVSACIICLWVPVGTVLGVFTLVLMQRPAVKALFNTPVPVPVPMNPPYPHNPYGPR